jgi:hypothetical protein
MRRQRIGLLILPVVLAATAFAEADPIVIDTTPGPYAQGVGAVHAPYGQTFLAEGETLVSFGFDLEGYQGAPFNAQGQVFATTAGIPSGSALFTSAPIAIGARGVYSFDAGGLTITPGVMYAVGLAITPESQGLIYIYRAGGQPGDGYFGFGGPIPNGDVGIDLAVRIVMNHEVPPVPEPSTLTLFALGAAGIAACARRRRRAPATATL